MDSPVQSLNQLEQIDENDLAPVEDLETLEDSPSDSLDIHEVRIQTQTIAKRERFISAQLLIPAPFSVEQIWQVLTDYESLPDFIPNLTISKRLPHPDGCIRLEQVGVQRLLKMNFKARVVLDLTEHHPDRIDFELVEGDFQRFIGAWKLEPTDAGTVLVYEVTVIPQRTLPIQFIEGRICKDLPLNLLAIRNRVQSVG